MAKSGSVDLDSAARVAPVLPQETRCQEPENRAKILSQNQRVSGAPEEIRTPDPQIRSLGETIEIIEVRYHKERLSMPSFAFQGTLSKTKLPQEVSAAEAHTDRCPSLLQQRTNSGAVGLSVKCRRQSLT